ncbi:MAG: ketopantoate reductase family protein [Halobacteria archaeon]
MTEGENRRCDVQVFGAGSLGSVVGAIMKDSGLNVRLVGREDHVESVRREGLRVEGELNLRVEPEADVKPGDADVTLVCVKSYDTRDAADALSNVDPGTVISLQNGFGNVRGLREKLGSVVLDGIATYGGLLHEPGVVECTGTGEIYLDTEMQRRPIEGDFEGKTGSAGGQKSVEPPELLENGGLDVEVKDGFRRRKWIKLGVNCVINPVSALTGLRNGPAVENNLGLLDDVAREVSAVASGEDVDLTSEKVYTECRRVAEATSGNRSSMLQDVSSGSDTEIESLNGYVVELAEKHGVSVPVSRSLYSLVRSKEVTDRSTAAVDGGVSE